MTYQFNSQKRPKDYSHNFDAHIYFENEKLELAKKIQNKISDSFIEEIEQKKFFVGDLIPVPIGPHPIPMFELNFDKEIFSKVVIWLMSNRNKFNILIHPISGNDYFDHTQGAIWLGESLILDLSKF